MQVRLPQQWTEKCKQLLEGLNENNVKYLLIGGLAKELRGCSPKQPQDTDLMIGRSHQNIESATQAILRVYPSHDRGTRARLRIPCRNRVLVGLPGPPYGEDVHVLTPPEEFNFDRAWGRSTREIIPNQGIEVTVAAVEDLERLDELRAKTE